MAGCKLKFNQNQDSRLKHQELSCKAVVNIFHNIPVTPGLALEHNVCIIQVLMRDGEMRG